MSGFSVPVATVPLWCTGIIWLVAAPVFAPYWTSHWARLARGASLLALAAGVTTLIFALLLSTKTPLDASRVFRFSAPLFLVLGIATLHNTYLMLNRPLPRAMKLIWAAGLAWAVFAVLTGPSWDAVRANADGYYFLPLHQGVVLIGVQVGNVALGIGICSLFVKEFVRRSERRYRMYAWAILILTLPFFANDLIVARMHRTLFPTVWVPVMVFNIIMWVELSRRVAQTDSLLKVDTLTGALTRGYGMMLAAQVGFGAGTGVVYLDVDRFKDVNDTWGHAAGDRLLQDVVERMKSVCRGDDLVIRMGGDEFAMIARDLPDRGMSEVAARIRSRLDEEPFRPQGAGDGVSVTVSCGWAWVARGRLEELIELADRNMYQMKNVRRVGQARAGS